MLRRMFYFEHSALELCFRAIILHAHRKVQDSDAIVLTNCTLDTEGIMVIFSESFPRDPKNKLASKSLALKRR